VIDSIDLRGWTRRELADGVALLEPRGRAALRLRPRIAGRRFDAIVAEVATAHGVGPGARLERRRLVTDDGELGVVAVGRVGPRDLAIGISGDGPLSCIDAIGEPGVGVALLVESLARSLGAGRGRRRARMFEYQPPPGWRGLRRDAATSWIHPAAPRVAAAITVHDARPLSTRSSETLHRLVLLRLADSRLIESGEPTAIESDFGLAGRLRESVVAGAAGPVARQAAAFGDDRFIYQATVEAGVDDTESAAAFERMIASFRPLPTTPPANAALAHWAE
jgi:hypothetical protein